MVGVTRIIFLDWFTLCILHTWLTVGILSCHLRQFLIDEVCLCLVTHLWIQINNGHYLCVTIFCGEFPCNLNDGTVNLDAKEVFGLSGDAHRCLERYRSVDVRHGGCSHESISIPGTAVIP